MPARLRASYTLITQEQSALACHTRRAKAGYRDSHYQGLRTTAACDTETQLKSPQNMRASGTLSNSLPSGITPTRSSTGHQRPHGQRGWKQLSWSLTVAFTVNCAELFRTREMQRFTGRRRYRHHHWGFHAHLDSDLSLIRPHAQAGSNAGLFTTIDLFSRSERSSWSVYPCVKSERYYA